MNAFRSGILLAVLAFLPTPPVQGQATALAHGAMDVHAPVGFAVGMQYDSTHVYVDPADFDRFVASLIATFGGTTGKQGVFQVTPTPSSTMSQAVFTPVGTISVFGFMTPVPYPFGSERSGYLVTDLDAAVASARRHGATRLVSAFPDPIGRDALVQWPGGVAMQFYWHTTKPSYAPLATVPENRIYLTPDTADAFVRSWLAFSRGTVVSDKDAVPGAEIGQDGKTYRRIRVASAYGRMAVLVTDGQLPWPYGREVTSFDVTDMTATLARAAAAGVETLVPLHDDGDRQSAMLRFPGGFIAQVHADTTR